KQLVKNKIMVLKFFVVIDKDVQLDRFKAREMVPDKQYKITDEDWRNRKKWDTYIEAMNEMLDRTNSDYAPWIIVEGNNKKYARIKVMEEYLKYAKKFLDEN
ncbi:MAG: polyphosphate kinase, partial [Anaerococcus sp.]